MPQGRTHCACGRCRQRFRRRRCVAGPWQASPPTAAAPPAHRPYHTSDALRWVVVSLCGRCVPLGPAEWRVGMGGGGHHGGSAVQTANVQGGPAVPVREQRCPHPHQRRHRLRLVSGRRVVQCRPPTPVGGADALGAGLSTMLRGEACGHSRVRVSWFSAPPPTPEAVGGAGVRGSSRLRSGGDRGRPVAGGHAPCSSVARATMSPSRLSTRIRSAEVARAGGSPLRCWPLRSSITLAMCVLGLHRRRDKAPVPCR